MKFSIYRYDPDRDSRPYMQDYDIALEPSDHMLLDAILRIKMHDDSLSIRRSCREGVCGSDAININGRNGLACITPVRGLKEPVVLRPLPSFPVIRDLIVDMTLFFKQYYSITRGCNRPSSARNWTACMNASCARAVPASARRSGGTRTSSSAPPACCRPTASLPTVATRRRTKGWTI